MFLIEVPQFFLSTEICMVYMYTDADTGPVSDSWGLQKITEVLILHFFHQFIVWFQILLIRMGRTTVPSIRQAIAHPRKRLFTGKREVLIFTPFL